MPLDGTYSVGYQFMDPQTGGRLLVAPDVAGVNEGLMEALCHSDVILFDGTFWSGDELAAMKFGARNAEQMGHITIKDCSLELLRKLNAREKVFIHINNTNPILASASPERTEIEAAGILIGFDGLEFKV
jgi:pyrroloquinoline quinone biosynthesis protein B